MSDNPKRAIPTEEAEAMLQCLRSLVQTEPKGFHHPHMKAISDPFGAALSALEKFHVPAATDGTSESVGGGRDFSSKPSDTEQRESEEKLMEFEQQTWDLYQLEGPLDHTRLLEECKVRAQRGDHEAERRLEVLDTFHDTRRQIRAHRWKLPPNHLEWQDLPEVTPDPRVQATLGPHLWALLIGNNNYPQSPLKGSVNDSLAWKSYLIEFLGVPESHITHIQDANRKTMVTALYDLRDNGEIKEGDHILFAYAGHGASYDAKRYSFENDIGHRAGSIEALCPVDRGLHDGGGTPDISDREVLLILSEIHDQTKVDVTVVLDCCHSGGGVRELGVDLRHRSFEPLIDPEVVHQMFVEADKHPRRRPSTISVRSPTWASDTADIYRPVLLAACQDTELAWEEPEHGLFTAAQLGP
ncbi:hypothetical protein H1R20_g3598, partial [Candolleomyces eurysporus]